MFFLGKVSGILIYFNGGVIVIFHGAYIWGGWWDVIPQFHIISRFPAFRCAGPGTILPFSEVKCVSSDRKLVRALGASSVEPGAWNLRMWVLWVIHDDPWWSMVIHRDPWWSMFCGKIMILLFKEKHGEREREIEKKSIFRRYRVRKGSKDAKNVQAFRGNSWKQRSQGLE